LGLDKIETYLSFQKRVLETKRQLIAFLEQAEHENKSVAAYGAPAKGNTLLNFCGISTNLIQYTVDRSPYKQGHFLPGSQIPIKSPEAIEATKPDYLVILPWNLKDEIMSQMSHIKSWGGKFVVPIPEVELI
jgi:C-methyltransferase.